MGLPLFPQMGEDIDQELATKLLTLNQLLRASTTIPNYLTYKSKTVSLTLDSTIQSLHIFQSKNLPPPPSLGPQAFLAFTTENEKLQAQIHAKEWESHFLLSPEKISQSLTPLIQNTQTRLALPEIPFSTQTPIPTPIPTNVQIQDSYDRLLASIINPQNFRQPNGLGRNSRSFTEKRFRDNVLAYSCVEDRERSPSGIPARLRTRKNWCHVFGGWSVRGVKMVRVVPLHLVSRKLASLFVSWEKGEGEFEGFFLEGGNGIALHEPFATAVSQGILALIPSSLNEVGDPEGYKFILTDQTYAEKDTGRGQAKYFHNKPVLPSPLNTRNNLLSLKFIYFRLLLTYITHLHLGKPTEWFTTLLRENPELFKPRHPPFKGEMLRFLLNFAGVDWDVKQGLKGLMDDGGRNQNTDRGEGMGKGESDWKQAEKMAKGIKVDCVSFGVEIERKRIEEEQRSLEVAVNGLYEVGQGAGTTDGEGNEGENQVTGFLIRVVLDDADDERETRGIVLSG